MVLARRILNSLAGTDRYDDMLFNSIVFIGFFTIVYILYLILQPRYKAQNVLLLIASYVFYGYWDWRFLSLLAISTVIDFHIGKKLVRHHTRNSLSYSRLRGSHMESGSFSDRGEGSVVFSL